MMKFKSIASQELSSFCSFYQDSYSDFRRFLNVPNFRNVLFPLLSLFYKEIVNTIIFFWLWQNEYPLSFFILYALLGATFSFLWGWWGDRREERGKHESKYILILYADILLLAIFSLLIFDLPRWMIILSVALVDTQSNARSTLATKKLICSLGNYHEKSLFLNKLCWTAIFICWGFFNWIKENQALVVITIFSIVFLAFLLYPKRTAREEARHVAEENDPLPFKRSRAIHLLLISFACFEAIFFLLWSFSERTHAPINFFALTGASCLVGNVLSFFTGKDKELKIIRHMYLSIFCLTLVSFLVLYYFPSRDTIFIIYTSIAMLSGIYLPYVFDEAMRIYGKHKRGKASGLVEIYNACGDVFSSLLIKIANKFFVVSLMAATFALIGYFITAFSDRTRKEDI